VLFNACSFVAGGPQPQEGGGLGQARDFAKNRAFFKFRLRFCQRLGIFHKVSTATLPKVGHFSSFDSNFAKNGAFVKFRQRPMPLKAT